MAKMAKMNILGMFFKLEFLVICMKGCVIWHNLRPKKMMKSWKKCCHIKIRFLLKRGGMFGTWKVNNKHPTF